MQRDFRRPGVLEEKEPTLLEKLSSFAERHVKIITFFTVVLIIAGVLGLITYLWQKSLSTRAMLSLGEANSIKDLEGACSRFRKTSVYPTILYRLANKYQEEGKLREAKKRYEEFLSKYPDHHLFEYVNAGYASVCRDLEWLEKKKEECLAPLILNSHPVHIKVEESSLLPKILPSTQLEIFTTKGELVVELFDNEAPYTVANFVALVEAGYYNGAKFTKVPPVKILIINPVKEVDWYIPWEITGHNPKPGHLAMVRYHKHELSSGGDFQIYLRNAPELKQEHAIFGRITKGLDIAKKLTDDDKITAIVITKRAPEYVKQKKIYPSEEKDKK
jgi:peptidyl-prolyl cis-trans isomerase B (cyclophilin B)